MGWTTAHAACPYTKNRADVLRVVPCCVIQDAWVLLEHEQERPGSCSPPPPQQPEEALPAVKLPNKRGRKPGGGAPYANHKRTKG